MAKRRVVRRRATKKPTGIAYTVGIDPSSKKLAVVVLSDKGLVVAAEELPIAKDKYEPEHAWLAGAAITRFIKKLPQSRTGDLRVYIERPVMVKASVQSMTVQAYVNGAVQSALLGLRIPVTLVSPSEWKKHVADNGNASKAAVAEALERRWPAIHARAAESQDLIDAASISLFGVEQLPS